MTEPNTRVTAKLADHATALSTYLDDLLSTESAAQDAQIVSTETPEVITGIEPGEDFSASITDTGAMKLAIPMQAIDAVLECPTATLIAEPQIAWISGEFVYQQKTIRVVDCEALLNSQAAHEGQKKLVLLLKDTQWGLLCYSAQENTRIAAEWVRWRETLTTKPWLSATIQQYQCALLDLEAFIQWLEQGAPGE